MAEQVAEPAQVATSPVKPKCPECKPGLPAWMATFSDLVTLLLTFFVLLLSFAKTETSKLQAALGSIREAFGGASLRQGEVIMSGKSPDNAISMLDSQHAIKPFPIEFLSTEGLLDKYEINRPYENTLKKAKDVLARYELTSDVEVYESPEDIRINFNDRILFKNGSVEIAKSNIQTYEKITKLLKDNQWQLFIEGYAAKGEKGPNKEDAYDLSMQRAVEVTKDLISRGIQADRLTAVAYGDSRQEVISGQNASKEELATLNRKVEFSLKRSDLKSVNKKIDHR